MKHVELLAPAGSIEALYAAVNAGADAVYLGGKQFGARRSADNFDDQALIEVIRHCHIHGVSVYVTVNTLVKASEMAEVLAFVDFLYRNDVDAVILQDLGLYDAIRARYPDLECHASTQMTLHSSQDAAFAKAVGFDRVVLSRELSYQEISEVQKQNDIMLEIFVHGALCISYSGQCIFSSYIGGRSGNRGGCAQPCRKAYRLLDREGHIVSEKADVYLMSPKDLKSIDHIEELKRLEPISLKVEGRMKSPEYVFAVINAYRKAIDGNGTLEDAVQLEKAFNRQFTEGHLFNANFSELMNYELPSHQGSLLGKVMHYEKGFMTLRLMDDISMGDELQMRHLGKTLGGRVEQLFIGRDKVNSASKGDTVRVNYKHEVSKGTMFYKTYDKVYLQSMTQARQIAYPKYGLKVHFEGEIGSPAQMTVYDENGESVRVTSSVMVERALKTPLSEERLIAQVGKLGGTVYYLESLVNKLESESTLSISEINTMRRDAVNALQAKRALKYPNRKAEGSGAQRLETKRIQSEASSAKLAVTYDFFVDTLDALKAVKKVKQPHRIFFTDLSVFEKQLEGFVENNYYPALNAVIRNASWEGIYKFLDAYTEACEKRMLKPICAIGHAPMAQLSTRYPKLEFVFDSSCNLMNDQAIQALDCQYGGTLYLSNEIALDEIKSLALKPYDIGYDVYGYLTLMKSAYCVVGGVTKGHSHCGACSQNEYVLEDAQGVRYPLVCDPKTCHMQILSDVPHAELAQMETLKAAGINRFKINMVKIDPTTIEQLVKALNDNRLQGFNSGNRSYLKKGIE